MGRIHLFEFNDQPWLPSAFRDYMTDYLSHVSILFKIYAPAVERVASVLEETGHTRIIDVCAGGGGPVTWVQGQLKEGGRDVAVTLTDKFPNLTAFERVKAEAKGELALETESIDATAVPESLTGVRTMFAAFHHFEPEMGKAILRDAAEKGQPICVFEITKRSAKMLISILFVPLFVLLLSVFIKPFRVGRLFWTYLVPIMPYLIAFDGFVSNLRTYSLEELKALTDEIEVEGYTWEMGEDASGPAAMTWLVGKPAA